MTDEHGIQWPLYLTGGVLGSLSCLMQCSGFDPPLGRILSIEGIFPSELTWVLTPLPQTLSDERIN